MARHILALDQGTTSTRAILFDEEGRSIGTAQRELQQLYPADGWVEHDPEHIWADSLAVCHYTLLAAKLKAAAVAAIGITNQRETSVLWDRATGKPVHNAIVWQDRRTANRCGELKANGKEARVKELTGLTIDPYFSGTKVRWMLDHVDGLAARARAGDIAFGTIDCYLLSRLTGRAVHATDVTNASRTLLFDIHQLAW